MSSDVISRLSGVNPVTVPEDSADTEAGRVALARILAEEPDRPGRSQSRSLVLRRRRMRLAAPPAVVVALMAMILVVSGGGSGGPSIIAQAYAATNTGGEILHYVVVGTTIVSNTTPTSAAVFHSRTEVWQSGQRSHIFEELTVRQRNGHVSSSRSEVTRNGRTIESHVAGRSAAGVLIRRTLPPTQISCDQLLELSTAETSGANCSPISVLRALYSSRGLRAAGETKLNGRSVYVIKKGALPGYLPSTQVTILTDPRTFAPLELRISSSGYRYLTRFEGYERIPLTARSSKLLTMLPHPGARVISIPLSKRSSP